MGPRCSSADTSLSQELHYCSYFSMLAMSVVDRRFSMLVMSVVDRRCEAQSDQTKDYKIGICCLSAEHAALRRKSKGLLAPNQDKVSE